MKPWGGWVAMVALWMALMVPGVARAEGPLSGGTRLYLEDEAVGDLTVSSFAAPSPPVTTDRLWVTVQVRDGARAVADATVWVTVTAPDGSVQRVEAVHELAAQPYDYTAALPVPTAGGHTVRVEVAHPQGTGETEYIVNVTEPLTNFIFVVMAIPAVLVALWLVHRFVVRLPASAAVLVGDDEPLAPHQVPPKER